LALRGALVVVLLVTLLRPTLPRWVDRLNVVFLLDHSDSVSLVARERAYRFVAEAVKHLKSGDRHEVIVFGEEAVVDQPLSNRPSVDRPKAVVSGRGTNIFQAMQLALATVTPGHANRLVMLTDGRQNVFAYRQALDQSGIHVYQAALDVEGDTIEDNNRAVGTVVVRGRPQVLLADRDRSHASSLAAALRSQNIEVTVVEPPGIPKDVAGLQKYDGVVLSNVSSLKLTRPQMAQIRDYVRDHGGGLMMIR